MGEVQKSYLLQLDLIGSIIQKNYKSMQRTELVDPDDMDVIALQSDSCQKPKVPFICCDVTTSESITCRNSEILHLGWWCLYPQAW